jgi:hypothetical protein
MKKIPCAKEQIKDIGPGRFVQVPNMGEIFLSGQHGDTRTPNVPKMYQKRAQNIPGGHHRDPENILK